MANMGLYQFDLQKACFKRKNRWLFKLDGISAQGTNSLPPLKSSRPSLKFREMQVRHLIEDVYYPAKADWEPMKLTLYDTIKTFNPVWDWIIRYYNPEKGTLNAPNSNQFIKGKDASLELYDGCGKLIETWIYEDAWPAQIDFEDVDMGSADILCCDLMLRYSRAYLVAA